MSSPGGPALPSPVPFARARTETGEPGGQEDQAGGFRNRNGGKLPNGYRARERSTALKHQLLVDVNSCTCRQSGHREGELSPLAKSRSRGGRVVRRRCKVDTPGASGDELSFAHC